MANDLLQPLKDAEQAIGARKLTLIDQAPPTRSDRALEAISDDMTRLHAEIKIVRNILAGMAANLAARR